MATLDETNIFGLPLKRQYGLEPEQKTPISETEQASRQEYEQLVGSNNRLGLTFEGFLKAKERKKVSDQRKAVAQALAEGDTTKAYEGFTELPMLTDQLPAYMTPVLGNIIDEKERRYFGEKAGRQFKDPRDTELEMLMASDPRDVKQYTEQDPVAGAMSTLAGASSLIGIGEGPSLVKAGIMGMFPSLRKGMTAKTMDGQGGGSGGISEIPPEPKKDYAGFVSSVEKVALGPQKFGSGQDLINFIESPKRSGISKKELEYIDFDKIRNNPDLTKEDVIKYIQGNRPQIYRVQRSEDNPTYRADESDNPLTFLPLNEEATRIANVEEQAFFRDEYGKEIADHNAILTNNPTLQNSNFVLNSENINDPSVLDDLERYLFKSEPEAYVNTNPSVIKINYPDGSEPALFNNNDLVLNPEAGGYTINDLQEVVKDGATIEFPALTRNADDIIEEASALRVASEFGNEIEVYEEVGNSGTTYKIIGTEDTGYRVMLDDQQVTRRGGSFEPEFYDDLADARARVQDEAYNLGDITEGADTFDTGSNPDQLLETAPFDVITGEATLPTRFGYQYGDYRLPIGGAENYREFTLHIANPKTATRYDSTKGTKHFGGGDELLHYRTTDRIDEDGKKVLFVEEIQSDLHSTASSTRESGNYELPKGTIEKTYADIEAIKPKDGKGLLAYDESVETEFEFTTPNGEVETLSPQQIVMIGKRLKGDNSYALTTPDGLYNYLDIGENKIKSFVDMYGKDNALKISNMLEPVIMSGKLPDLPYKGNDYIELAVKDIMKLASEGDYDRVAFTNPATQLRRNQKDLEYIDEIEINQVPKLTEAEVEFDKKWSQNRNRSMVSTMSPDSNVTETISGRNKIRLDGGLNNADLNSFVGTHTDFVVNEPQTQKFWQDFHKNQNTQFNKQKENYFDEYMVDNLDDLDNAIKNEYGALNDKVDYIFARYDSPPTPSQLAEDLYQSGIIGTKKQKLKYIKDANDGLIKASVGRPQGALTKDEAYSLQLESDEAISGTVKLPNKPFDEITLDDIFLSDADLDYINQDVRRGISKIMRRFYDHTLPNVEDAGKYIVKQKGTGYKIDSSKFMVERGDITEGYRNRKFDTIDDMIKELRLNENLQERIRNDVQKGNIPASTIDSQIYKVEAEGGSGKKPLDMYGKIIPQQLKKIAQKYDKNAKPQLKRVLYSDEDGIDAEQLYSDFKAEEKLKLEEAETGNIYGRDFEEPLTHEAATIDITPEMRKAILTEGVNVMYKGGIVNKVKSMDKPIQGNRREI